MPKVEALGGRNHEIAKINLSGSCKEGTGLGFFCYVSSSK
jgi:hypothetical protein